MCRRKLRDISPQPPTPFGVLPINSMDGVQHLMRAVFGYGGPAKHPWAYPDFGTVASVLDTLAYRDREIVKHYLGLDGVKKRTFKAIGSHFKISGNRARQLFDGAMRRLRHPNLSGRLGQRWYGPYGGLSKEEYQALEDKIPHGPPAPLVHHSVKALGEWRTLEDTIFTPKVVRMHHIYRSSLSLKPALERLQQAMDQLPELEAQLLIRHYDLGWTWEESYWWENRPSDMAASLGIYSLEEYYALHDQAIARLQTRETWDLLRGKHPFAE
jgi:hypothetical protein